MTTWAGSDGAAAGEGVVVGGWVGGTTTVRGGVGSLGVGRSGLSVGVARGVRSGVSSGSGVGFGLADFFFFAGGCLAGLGLCRGALGAGRGAFTLAPEDGV